MDMRGDTWTCGGNCAFGGECTCGGGCTFRGGACAAGCIAWWLSYRLSDLLVELCGDAGAATLALRTGGAGGDGGDTMPALRPAGAEGVVLVTHALLPASTPSGSRKTHGDKSCGLPSSSIISSKAARASSSLSNSCCLRAGVKKEVNVQRPCDDGGESCPLATTASRPSVGVKGTR